MRLLTWADDPYVDRDKRWPLLAHGQALAQAGHLRAAARLLGLADEAQPDPGITVTIASLLLDAGDHAAARSQLEAGSLAHGWDSRSRYLRAIALARENDLAAATTAARELSHDPVMGPESLILLIDLLLATGDVEGAREQAETALRQDPGSAEAMLALARVAGHQGRADEQLAIVERARALDPDNPRVGTARGIALVQAGSRSRGQRELARVVSKRPQDRAPAIALVRSSLPSRKARWVFLATFFLLPVLVSVVATILFPGRPHPWLSSAWVLSYLSVVVLSRAVDRLRTDRSVIAIKRDARRRLIGRRPLFPSLRPMRWLLLAVAAGSWALMLFAAAILGPSSAESRVFVSAVAIPGVAVSVAAMWLWRRRRQQLARGEPRRFNPSSCQCHVLSTLGGDRADTYARRHLTLEADIYATLVERFRCPFLGVRWVRFSKGSGLSGGVLPVILRLPLDFAPAEESSHEGTGFYL